MSNLKHTKGSWEITGNYLSPNGEGWVQVGSKDERWIAEAKGTHVGPKTAKTAMANAKLIAAAPDLLACCLAAKAMYEAQGITEKSMIGGEQYKDVLKAIKKATK